MLGSRRIAQKIFLGYLLALGVLTVAGLIVPFFLSTLLGRVTRDYESTVRLVEQVSDLRRATADSESNVRGYILYRDEAFRRQFLAARTLFRSRVRDLTDYADQYPESNLAPLIHETNAAYGNWLRDVASPEIGSGQGTAAALRSSFARQVAAFRCTEEFQPVGDASERLSRSATRFRDQQLLRARFSEGLRTTFTLGAPVIALLIALLIGRSVSLGITRPLEQLTRAAEELEKGNTSRILMEETDYGEDEVGELGRAFNQMARTIGQREAVLRTQNEALGAIGRRFEAVLNATNDAIVLLDPGGGFSLVNRRFSELFGIEADVLMDQTYEQASPLLISRFQNKAAVRERMREILADPDTVVTTTMDLLEPAPRTLRLYSAPVRRESGAVAAPDGTSELLGRIFVFRDVTQETIVDRMKTEFVSTVSHELRTPLTAIKGYIDLMVSGRTGEVNEVQREFLTMVQVSTRRLTNLINDLLDVSRIESGRMAVRRESVDYLPLVRDALRIMANEAERKGITLELEAPADPASAALPPVSGDADRITQVLVNLLSNGIKYTQAGGRVSVSIAPEAGFVTTTVADTGIGISAEDQKKLFQKFFRADNSTTRDAGGTGLGLAITKAILDKMRGSIRVESAPGEGSRFIFTLPVADAAEETAGAQKAGGDVPAAGSLGKGLVLAVDLEPPLIALVTAPFRRAGYMTSGAIKREEAVRRARDLRPDAVTLNVATRPADALGVFHALRTTPSTRAVPLALLSLRKTGNGAGLAFPVMVTSRAELGQALAEACGERPPGAPARVLVIGEQDLAAEVARAAPGFEVHGTAPADAKGGAADAIVVDVNRFAVQDAPREPQPQETDAAAAASVLMSKLSTPSSSRKATRCRPSADCPIALPRNTLSREPGSA